MISWRWVFAGTEGSVRTAASRGLDPRDDRALPVAGGPRLAQERAGFDSDRAGEGGLLARHDPQRLRDFALMAFQSTAPGTAKYSRWSLRQ